MTTPETDDDREAGLVEALSAVGIPAVPANWLFPSRLQIAHASCWIVLSTAQGAPGEADRWEATYDSGHDRVQMRGGPPVTASLPEVVAWVQRLLADADAE